MLPRLSRHDALARVRHCLEKGIVEPHPHFLRALKDDGLDFGDAIYVLRTGNIYDEPEFDVRFQQWRYLIQGKEPDGGLLAIVFTFRAIDNALLITAYVKQK
jgi:hypothetical protein